MDHRVDDLGVSYPEPFTGAGQQVRAVAHRLHPAGDGNVDIGGDSQPDQTPVSTTQNSDQDSIIDANDHILPEVLAARRRGVWFDVANGRTGHLEWGTFDRILQAGFWPDTISTDGNTTSQTAESVIDFPNVLSKFLNFGMTLDQVITRATVNASRIFPLFHDRGTLNVGAPADVAVLELREGTFEFVDNYENTRTGRQRLFPSETVLSGERVPRA